ncbi:MAG: hypothetical protein ACFFB0_03535 [Promethearchaeota archaeon]
MSEHIDLKTIEKNVLKTAHQHGFLDMIFGFVLGGMAFGPIFRESLPAPYKYFLWPLILIIIASILVFTVVKYIIQPRMGFVKPGPSLRSTKKKLLIVVLINFIILLVFFILPLIGIGLGIQVGGIVFLLLIGLFFMPVFIVIAYLLKYPRLYLIGMLIWLAIFINELLYTSLDYRIRWFFSFGIIGSIIFIMGSVIFIRFLKKYPLLKKEMP